VTVPKKKLYYADGCEVPQQEVKRKLDKHIDDSFKRRNRKPDQQEKFMKKK